MATNLITLSIQDAGGNISPVSVYVERDDADTLADLTANYAEPLWNALKPLINGVLTSATVQIGVDIAEFDNNTPSAISDVEEKAFFNFKTAGNKRVVRMTIPTVLESIFTQSGAGFEVDALNSDVQAFYVLMTEDIGSGGINATDSHGDDISQVLRGIQYFKG